MQGFPPLAWTIVHLSSSDGSFIFVAEKDTRGMTVLRLIIAVYSLKIN